MNTIMKQRKTRKGFSLVELVVVILIIAILAVAVFAGGSAVIKKSQVSRTVSDLHNFSVAVESTLNENPEVANITTDAKLLDIGTKLGKNLPAEYKLTQVTAASAAGENITLPADATDDSFVIYKSDKKDAWDNNYYVIIDYADRHGASTEHSDFFITVVSAGPNAKTAVSGTIDSDDIFLLGQYTNGDVAAKTYNVASEAVTGTYTGSTITNFT